MVRYTVRDETPRNAAPQERPCYRVYREDGLAVATYDDAESAYAEAAAAMASHADLTLANLSVSRP